MNGLFLNKMLLFETNSSNNSIASSSINLKKNQINALRIMKNECKIVISSSWNCWIPGIGKPCVFYGDIKEILDKVLPNWSDINTQFTDEQFERARSMGISDSALYKQAGNSIVVNCLYYIFKELFKNYIVK